jgi:hypothetical protein
MLCYATLRYAALCYAKVPDEPSAPLHHHFEEAAAFIGAAREIGGTTIA